MQRRSRIASVWQIAATFESSSVGSRAALLPGFCWIAAKSTTTGIGAVRLGNWLDCWLLLLLLLLTITLTLASVTVRKVAPFHHHHCLPPVKDTSTELLIALPRSSLLAPASHSVLGSPSLAR